MNTKSEYGTSAEGLPRGNPYYLTYSPSGRLIGKSRDNNSVTLSASVDMAYGWCAHEHQIIKHMTVGNCDDYQPHAVKRMFDNRNGTLNDIRREEEQSSGLFDSVAVNKLAGNLGQVSMVMHGDKFESGRFLFWTEDNRMHAAVDDKHYSYYAYDHSSQRRLKLVGDNESQDVNADFMATYTLLNEPTLYPSAYMVLTNKDYTNVTEVESRASSLALPRCSNVTERKHYYAGSERVAARLGGGGLDALYHAIGNNGELQTKADLLFGQSLEQVNNRVLHENNLDCIMHNEFAKEEFGYWIGDIPYQMKAEVECDHSQFKDMVNSMLTDYHNGEEKEVYFYHSDHLGSASWITDFGGVAVQHIQYLPYGEQYVDQRTSGYHERFTFTGKERDEETGYGYFGTRYMDHELMTMWLSVDPMADKYPNISPYNYCMWNPIKLIDPNGMDTIVFDGNGNFSNRINADGKHMGRVLDNNGNKRFDFEFACQQDADRCCSPGSQEEYDIYDRDKLSHAMDCPAEEKVPIYRIELVWQKEIISQLKESGACDKSFLPRIGYALRESDGGHLDFDNVNRHNGVWNDQTLYIPMVPGKKYAHNVSNMGNFLWGAAMHKMGISYKDIILGSNLHALIKHHEFDSRDDQLSIGLGYLYSMKTARSR